MAPITIAVAGATGQIGVPVVHAALSSQFHPNKIGRVLVLTRDANSEKTKALVALGAEAIQVDKIQADHLKGVDVFISTVGIETPTAVKDEYARAASEAGVKVYIPSEFGGDPEDRSVDHDLVFETKQDHTSYVKKLAGDRMKMVAVYIGFFLDSTIAPWFGFDTKGHRYQVPGDPAVRFTLTSLGDVGRSVASLAVLAVADPNSVPDSIRICGDAKSPKEIAEIMTKESGEQIQVEGGDWEKTKLELDQKYHGKGMASLLDYLRLVITSGKTDFGERNDNELINPAQSLWRWKTVTDYAKETKGRPFCD